MRDGQDTPDQSGDAPPANWRRDPELRVSQREMMESPVFERRVSAARILAKELRMPMSVNCSELPETPDDDMVVAEIDGEWRLLILPPERSGQEKSPGNPE